MPIDYSKYPSDWKEIVKRIRKRSGGKCEICGLENKSTVWSVQFYMKWINGRYSWRKVWFRSKEDAYREARNDYDVKPVTVVLTVAHLDHDETNHNVSDDRLMDLCQVCHLRYDAKEKFRRSMQKHWDIIERKRKSL